MMLLVFIGMLMFSSLIYYAEFAIEGSHFENIPLGFWWAAVTMTTVGYGDLYPQSAQGYIIGGVCALAGLVIAGLPIPIISNNFNKYYEYSLNRHARKSRKEAKVRVRKESVLKKWSMVTKAPSSNST